MHDDEAFKIEICEDGSVRIGGKWGAHILQRIVLSAKFETELKPEILLSPHVNRLVDELGKVSPVPPIDWASPGVLTPPSFIEAAEVVRRYRDEHEPGHDLEKLIWEAMKPYTVPLERLGISPTEPSATSA